MIFFLRIFRFVRDLEKQVNELGALRVQYESQIRVLDSRNARLEESAIKAWEAALNSSHHVEDWIAESMTGRKIHGTTAPLPELDADPGVLRPNKMQARDARVQATRDFVDQYVSRLAGDEDMGAFFDEEEREVHEVMANAG